MLSTKTLLNPFNALLAKVHHPPPLDKRESRRLLEALTTSFRKNLDKEHGYWPQDLPANSSAAPHPRSNPLGASSSVYDPHRRPTDRHVRAILSNPLFSYDPSKTAPDPPAERDPIEVFDQAVAKGLMSPQRAAGVLIAKSNAIAQSSSLSVNQSMAASGTALRVLQWLRSSGLERHLSFITYQPLITHLIPFMVREGLEEVAWTWLDMCMRAQGPRLSTDEIIECTSNLLSALVRTKVSPDASLDSGYASIIRAGDMFCNNTLFRPSAISSWRDLSLWSTVFAQQRPKSSGALFDGFTSMSEQLQGLAETVLIDRAHLDLHHPTHPDATLAVRLLNSLMLERLRDQLLDDAAEYQASKTIAKRVVFMATDAAQQLTRTGREAEAELVGNRVIDNLAAFLRREVDTAGIYLQMFQRGPSAG